MSGKTGIEWTDATWNPVTGCTKLSPASPGCANCYASTFAERFRGTPGHYFEQGFDVQLRPEKLDQPLRWRRPRRIFVNSMSDLFHDQVPDEYIAQVFAVMASAPQHTFQLLTKRHARMRSLLTDPHGTFFEAVADNSAEGVWRIGGGTKWPLQNVWLGVSTENQQWADIRIPALLNTPAAVRFISAEPLLGPIDLFGDRENIGPAILRTGVQVHPSTPSGPAEYDYDDQVGLDWVIVGGESGRGARPIHPDWVRGLRDQCQSAGVSFLFKQWGEFTPECQLGISGGDGFFRCACNGSQPSHIVGMKRVGKKAAGRRLDGRTWDEFPEAVTA